MMFLNTSLFLMLLNVHRTLLVCYTLLNNISSYKNKFELFQDMDESIKDMNNNNKKNILNWN